MRKIWSSRGLFICGWLILSVCSIQAQQIAAIDFSKAQGYVDGNIVGQPAGQAVKWLDGGGAVDFPLFNIANEALVVTQDGTNMPWILYPIAVQTGKFTVTFDWQYVGPADGTVDVGFCISAKENYSFDGNDAPTFNEQGVMVRMEQENKLIDARNGDWAGGGSYDKEVEISYLDGKKFSMRYEVNAKADTQTFTAYVKKEGESEVELCKDFGFRRDCPNGLDTIAIWEDGGFADTKVIIDNIKIVGPAAIGNWELHE